MKLEKVEHFFFVTLFLFLSLFYSSCSSHRSHKVTNQPTFYSSLNRSVGLIVIDAGHGGRDVGTSSTNKTYQEKNLTLATAKMVEDHLKRFGYRPFLTRSHNEFIPLKKRATIANEKRARLFVSIHFNSAPSKKAEGVEIYYYDTKKDRVRTNQSRYLANHLLTYITKFTHAPSRGVKHGNFSVIRNTDSPAVLVEGGFLSNRQEMQKIKNPRYLNKIAWGIAKGIDAYFHGQKRR